jgi:hypothetical protein
MVQYEQGHVDYPVVLGGIHTGRPSRPVTLNTVDGKPGGPDSTPDPQATRQTPPQQTEVPLEVYQEVMDLEVKAAEGTITEDEQTELDRLKDLGPTRRVVHKSPRGHTIVVEDRPGAEFLKIIDRAGQAIELYCPVNVASSLFDIETRGARAAGQATALLQDAMVEGTAWVRIQDLAGQELILDARRGQERVRLVNRNPGGGTLQRVELNATPGSEFCEIVDSAGNRFRLNAAAAESVVLEDYAGNRISFDPENGTLKLAAEKSIELQAQEVAETLTGNLSREVTGDASESFANNHAQQVVGDAIKAVMGNATYTVGGAVNFVISGIDPSDQTPMASADAFNVTTAAGGITATVAGVGNGILLQALASAAGGIQLSTVAQAISLVSTSGVITASTNGGQNKLEIAASTLTLAMGSTTKIEVSPTTGVAICGGGQSVNNLPACLFTGAAHSTLVPGPKDVQVPVS